MGVSDLIDTVFSLYRRNFWLLVLVVAVVQVPYQIVSWLLGLGVRPEPRFLTHFHGHKLDKAQLHQLFAWLGPSLGLRLVILILLLVVAFPLETAAFTKVVADRYQGRRTSLGQAYEFATGRWLALIGLGLLILGLIFGALIVLVLVAVLLGALLHGLGAVLDFLLVVAAVIFGFVAYVRVVLSAPVLVLEHLGPADALRRSWELTRGGAWRAFGVLLLLTIMVGIAGFLVDLLINAGATAGGGLTSPEGHLIELIGAIVVQSLLSPFVAVGLVLLYFDFRLRKEGPESIQPAPGPASAA
jgi:membrane-anchored glycerophosphoryl diester phosphodiesterase (GDPDase)